MIEIYFDDTYIDSDNYANITNDFKQFDNEFMIGTTPANTFKLEVPKACFNAIPSEITIKIDNEDYAHLIVDKYEYKDNDLVTFELTDKMTLFNFNYDASEIVPCTVADILEDICDKAGVELGTTSAFTNSTVGVDFYNNTIQARQYLSYIAELMGGFARIGKDGKLYLETYTDTNITIDINDCEDFKIGEHHTIERVVFDNGLLKFETDDDETLETLYLNSDNVYINNETTFDNIASVILGFDFYSFKTGNCPINDNVMAGDVISFVNDNDTYKTIAQYQINYNGQWLGGYELDINSKKQQETKQVGSNDLIKQLSVKLNRDENELSIMAQRVEENSDAITELNLNDEAVEVLIDNIRNNIEENYTTTEDVEQLIINSQEGITNTISHSGGTNLIRNSALLFEENDGYEYWTGSLLRGSADTYGVTSETGTVILTQSSSATQQIVLTPNDYTLTFKYKKLSPVSTITFKVNEETQDLSETEGEFEKVIHLDSSNITIDFLSSIDNGYIIYDLMLNKGDVASPYTQHANETTTDTVKIGKGISVESNSTDTTTKMDSDGFRVTSKGNQSDILLRATDTGTFTKTLEVLVWASIVNLYFQEVNGQTWITGL